MNSRKSLLVRMRTALGAGLVLLCVVACGANSAPPSTTASSTPFAHPVTVSDCTGHRSTFTAPPTRVVTLTASVLEMLYWLGVEKTVVGNGTPPRKGSFPPKFDAAAQKVPRLAPESAPGAFKPVAREVLLSANPDFVIGGFPSNFNAQGATSQAELAGTGVNSYLAMSTSCSSALSSAQTNLDVVFQDLRNLGKVFGVEQRAESLVAGMTSKLSAVRARLTGASAPSLFPFEFDEGTDTPYAAGNRQTINAVITLAGGRNVFADTDKAYQKVGWEEIVKRNPDQILVITYARASKDEDAAAQARADQFLRTFAPIANLSAVKQQRFVHLIYEYGSVGGVRNGDAVGLLAPQLFPDRFGR